MAVSGCKVALKGEFSANKKPYIIVFTLVIIRAKLVFFKPTKNVP